MRLWHEKLIPYLLRQQLLGQHRECCALRGNGWGKKHATVDYVFTHSPMWLAVYHCEVIWEMQRRGYSCDYNWLSPTYRGKHCAPWELTEEMRDEFYKAFFNSDMLYPEHDDKYLQECLDNLEKKGVHIEL